MWAGMSSGPSSVFLDEQRARGVAHEDHHGAVAVGQRLQPVGEFVKPRPARLDRQVMRHGGRQSFM